MSVAPPQRRRRALLWDDYQRDRLILREFRCQGAGPVGIIDPQDGRKWRLPSKCPIETSPRGRVSWNEPET
jgi:hypothetical protein